MPRAGPFSSANRSVIARRVVGLFFPQRPLLKLDVHGYSPTILHKILTTSAEVKSHNKAAKLMKVLCELAISGRHVNRLANEVGLEMAAQRDQATEDYVHHRRQEPATPAPEVVAIAMDGGRVMTRTAGQGTGVHGQGWKEDKVACLLTLQGATFTEDPHPEPPQCFLDAPKVDKMVREIQAHHGVRQENELPQLAELALGKPVPAAAAVEPEEEALEDEVLAAAPAWPPKRTKKTAAPVWRPCTIAMGSARWWWRKLIGATSKRQRAALSWATAALGFGRSTANGLRG